MAGGERVAEIPLGSQTIEPYLRTPYIFYEKKIAELIRQNHRVLELGAGAGLHTRALLQTGANVIASDISPNSLSLLKQRFQSTSGNLKTEVADMESLPFDASSFDVIACAGSLSYGEPHVVDAEIRRVLRPGGMLICVDSLNHNPIYRLNRWLHYRRGERTRSTLQRIPDLSRISALGSGFADVSVRYFGAFSYAMPAIASLFGEAKAQVVSDRLDELIGAKRSAFKFVLVAQGLR
jgi:ubiquinone/menaquinone biosynthesis C-methylase UbiE